MSRRLALALIVASSLLAGCGTTKAPSRAVAQAIGAQHRFPRANAAVRAAQLAGATQAGATRGPVLENGLALLKARMPHDLRRTDVPRWLSARALFGQLLTRYAESFEQSRPAEGYAILPELEDALQSWSDATNGIAPETAI